jgi:hypothetical protein
LALLCLYFRVSFSPLSLPTSLSFIHFLSLKSLQVPTIKNYISSIKSRFCASLSCGVFDSPSLLRRRMLLLLLPNLFFHVNSCVFSTLLPLSLYMHSITLPSLLLFWPC